MAFNSFSVLIFLAICISFIEGQLYLVPSKYNSTRKIQVVPGTQICPPVLSDDGISVLCVASKSSSVFFFLDEDHVSFSANAPFYMFGSSNGVPVAWEDWAAYSGRRNISCLGDHNNQWVASVYIGCSRALLGWTPIFDSPKQNSVPALSQEPEPKEYEPSPMVSATPFAGSNYVSEDTEMTSTSPSPQPSHSPSCRPSQNVPRHAHKNQLLPSTLLLVDSKRPNEFWIALRDGLSVCPTMFPSRDFSIECKGATASKFAAFFVQENLYHREYRKPYYIAGDKHGHVIPWQSYPTGISFRIGCKLSDGISSSFNVTFKCS